MPLHALPGFDEATRRHRWDGTRLPALYRGDRPCSTCSHGIIIELPPATQPALFYHGGYGAAQRSHYALCTACLTITVTTIETINPRTL